MEQREEETPSSCSSSGGVSAASDDIAAGLTGLPSGGGEDQRMVLVGSAMRAAETPLSHSSSSLASEGDPVSSLVSQAKTAGGRGGDGVKTSMDSEIVGENRSKRSIDNLVTHLQSHRDSFASTASRSTRASKRDSIFRGGSEVGSEGGEPRSIFSRSSLSSLDTVDLQAPPHSGPSVSAPRASLLAQIDEDRALPLQLFLDSQHTLPDLEQVNEEERTDHEIDAASESVQKEEGAPAGPHAEHQRQDVESGWAYGMRTPCGAGKEVHEGQRETAFHVSVCPPVSVPALVGRSEGTHSKLTEKASPPSLERLQLSSHPLPTTPAVVSTEQCDSGVTALSPPPSSKFSDSPVGLLQTPSCRPHPPSRHPASRSHQRREQGETSGCVFHSLGSQESSGLRPGYPSFPGEPRAGGIVMKSGQYGLSFSTASSPAQRLQSSDLVGHTATRPIPIAESSSPIAGSSPDVSGDICSAVSGGDADKSEHHHVHPVRVCGEKSTGLSASEPATDPQEPDQQVYLDSGTRPGGVGHPMASSYELIEDPCSEARTVLSQRCVAPVEGSVSTVAEVQRRGYEQHGPAVARNLPAESAACARMRTSGSRNAQERISGQHGGNLSTAAAGRSSSCPAAKSVPGGPGLPSSVPSVGHNDRDALHAFVRFPDLSVPAASLCVGGQSRADAAPPGTREKESGVVTTEPTLRSLRAPPGLPSPCTRVARHPQSPTTLQHLDEGTSLSAGPWGNPSAPVACTSFGDTDAALLAALGVIPPVSHTQQSPIDIVREHSGEPPDFLSFGPPRLPANIGCSPSGQLTSPLGSAGNTPLQKTAQEAARSSAEAVAALSGASATKTEHTSAERVAGEVETLGGGQLLGNREAAALFDVLVTALGLAENSGQQREWSGSTKDKVWSRPVHPSSRLRHAQDHQADDPQPSSAAGKEGLSDLGARGKAALGPAVPGQSSHFHTGAGGVSMPHSPSHVRDNQVTRPSYTVPSVPRASTNAGSDPSSPASLPSPLFNAGDFASLLAQALQQHQEREQHRQLVHDLLARCLQEISCQDRSPTKGETSRLQQHTSSSGVSGSGCSEELCLLLATAQERLRLAEQRRAHTSSQDRPPVEPSTLSPRGALSSEVSRVPEDSLSSRKPEYFFRRLSFQQQQHASTAPPPEPLPCGEGGTKKIGRQSRGQQHVSQHQRRQHTAAAGSGRSSEADTGGRGGRGVDMSSSSDIAGPAFTSVAGGSSASVVDSCSSTGQAAVVATGPGGVPGPPGGAVAATSGATGVGDRRPRKKRDGRRARGAGGGIGVPEGLDASSAPLPSSCSMALRAFRLGTLRPFTLRDVGDNALEFCKDPFASTFLQEQLEVCSVNDRMAMLLQLLPHVRELTADPNGSYVLQKFLLHGSDKEKEWIAAQLAGDVVRFSLEVYGCRVIQRALESLPLPAQLRLVAELEDHVIACVEDQHGNHVIQKCAEQLPPPSVQFIIDAFKGQEARMAVHSYGCRVIQRLLEACPVAQVAPLVDAVMQELRTLIRNQFGNYVVQHILEFGREADKLKIIKLMCESIVPLSTEKYSCNVVERALTLDAMGIARRDIISAALGGAESSGQPLKIMMLDRYGNYVVQRMMDVAPSDLRPSLLSLLRQQVDVLKKFTYGKHIVTALDRIDSNTSSPSTDSATGPSSATGAPEPFTPTGRGGLPGTTVAGAGAPGKTSGTSAPPPPVSRSNAVNAGSGSAQAQQPAGGQRHQYHRAQPQQQQTLPVHLGSDTGSQSVSPSALSPAASGSVRSRGGNEFGAGAAVGWGRRGGGQHFQCRNLLTGGGSPQAATGVAKGGRATTEARPTGFDRQVGGGGGGAAEFIAEDRRLSGSRGRADEAHAEWLNPARLQQLLQIDHLSPSARASALAALQQCLGSLSGISPSSSSSTSPSSRFSPAAGGGVGDVENTGMHQMKNYADSELLRCLSQVSTPTSRSVLENLGASHGLGAGVIGAGDNQEGPSFVRAHTSGGGTSSASAVSGSSPVQLLPYLSFPGASQPVRGGAMDAPGGQPALPHIRQHGGFSQLQYLPYESSSTSFRSLNRAASSGFLYGRGAAGSGSASAPGAVVRSGSGEHCSTHQREGSSASGGIRLTPEMVSEVLNVVQQYQRHPAPSTPWSRERDGSAAAPSPPQNPTNPRRPP